ncbi:30S ribosomal protein S21 [Candidatus Woesebacteria bacterium]|nr:30S ribosomal protein S21 [Candidatus Woesebacteria bacterium]HNV45016.1 30S ribosomal protein S21 [Candidatus Woesebacteria bacterium]HOA11725.1 30S ribosomal protein S21 [Candidatus Woesebacteria bacterium]HOC07355.1 30S ribosomal protein S21 [Candidatus Woesebacteria bacterium]HOI05346.1 30S ribosomal protein S21 [Candidatus Woesebacteria bacterium]
MINLPVIIKAKKNQSTADVIRQFKKASASAGTVQIAKDRRYFAKPSRIKADKTAERSRLKKRAQSLKKRKNVSPAAIARIQQRLGS